MLDTISAKELDRYVEDSGALIVDLRAPEEYEMGHIRGALNIWPEEIRTFRPGKDRVLILYCDRGGVSMEAARRLDKRGYRVKSVVGGYHAYRGDQIVTGKRPGSRAHRTAVFSPGL